MGFGECVHYMCIFVFLFNLSLIIDSSNATNLERYKRQSGHCKEDQEYQCSNGQCIDKSLVCDGVRDCADSSDETKDICNEMECPRFSFKCDYGACVDGDAKCDGRADCADKSDESLLVCPYFSSQEMPCPKPNFQCLSGQCINGDLLCDGNADCKDGSDETHLQCSSLQCGARFFRCNYGACIDRRFRCDGIKQCADGSDEFTKTCLTNGTSTSISTTSTTRRPTTAPTVPTPKKTPPTPPVITPTRTTPTLLPDSSGASCPEIEQFEDKTFVYTCDQNKKSGKACYNSEKTLKDSTHVKFSCNPQYQPEQKNMKSICSEGKWYPEFPKCLKICDKLTPINVDLKCYRGGVDVDCEGTLIAGTKIRPQCKKLHVIKGFVPDYRELVCQENGKWDNILFTCTPECGRSLTKAITLISNGEKENYGDSPWHVAVYNKEKTLICGGTIIHPYLVLSAAHCFHDRVANKKQNPNNYEIVVSKVTRNYAVRDNDSQNVHKIRDIRYSTRGFDGIISYYANDIVIIILLEKISITATVLPACVDWLHSSARPEDKFQIEENTPGKVSGWGMNEKGTYNESLFGANLPYISREKCFNTVPSDFQPYLTFDKFCAGSEKGSGVLPGDSGGGLLFRENNFYYIRGIVSLKQPTKTPIAAFTDLGEHVDWILSVKNEVDQYVWKDDTISIRG